MGLVRKLNLKIAKKQVRRKNKAYAKEALKIQKETKRTERALRDAEQREKLANATAKREKAEARNAAAKARVKSQKRSGLEGRIKKAQNAMSSLRKGFRKTQRKLNKRR